MRAIGWRGVVALLAAVLLAAAPAPAQRPWLAPAAIAQLVDEVLRAVVHPDSSLSGVRVGERGLRFDHGRTLAAFGDSTATGPLPLRSATRPGDSTLLADCEQVGGRPCAALGWNAYVWVEPLSIVGREAVVRAHVLWASRPGSPTAGVVPPSGRVFLTGFAVEVHLRRASDGRWRFVRLGSAIVGD